MTCYEIPASIVAAVREITRRDDLIEGLVELIGTEPKTCANETCGKEFLIQAGRSESRNRTKGVKYCSAKCARAHAQRAWRQRQNA